MSNEPSAPPRVYLDGFLDVPQERWDEVCDALDAHIALTRAEAGCIKFDVVPCTDVERRLLVSEVFKDQTAFDAHQARTKASAWARASAGIPRHYSVRKGD